jgi:hypothetical protein
MSTRNNVASSSNVKPFPFLHRVFENVSWDDFLLQVFVTNISKGEESTKWTTAKLNK